MTQDWVPCYGFIIPVQPRLLDMEIPGGVAFDVVLSATRVRGSKRVSAIRDDQRFASPRGADLE